MDNKTTVLDLIGTGKENAAPLLRLVFRSGLSERAVRKAIQQLRDDGHLIINDQDGKGYYIATEHYQVMNQYIQDYHRHISIARRMKAARQVLKEAGMLKKETDSPEVIQMSLFDDPLTTT